MNLTYASVDEMAAWASNRMETPPDFVIGDPAYLKRWYIIPKNPMQNVYLHLVLRDDDDRALHDHPWENTSYVISGSYREITPEGIFVRRPGDLIQRPATARHRLELIDGAPAVSLFFTGPRVREWGFDCPNGWRHWKEFTGGANGELVGRGCGE